MATALAVLALAGLSSTADAAGLVTVNIVGAGHVTSIPPGIDCTRSPAGALTGTCAIQIDDTEGSDDQCFPQPAGCPLAGEIAVTGAPAGGFAFANWGVFCAAGVNPCGIAVGGARTMVATFNDVQSPTAAVTQPANGAAVSGRIPLAADAADNGVLANVVMHVRGTALAPFVAPPFSTVFDTQTLADGPAAITATATDGAGRATTSAAVNVTLDNTKPALTVTGPDNSTLGPGVVPAWTIAATDVTTGPPTVQCSVVPAGQAAAFHACTSATTERLAGQPDGRFTLTVRAADRAGNTTDQARTFAVDTGPPETTITSGPDDGATTDGTTITWGFASSEPGSTFQCRVSPGAFGPCSAAAEHTAALTPGTYTFEVRATDALGNVDPTPAHRTVTVVDVATTVLGTAGTAGGPGKQVVLIVVLTYHYRRLDAHATALNRLVLGSIPTGATVTVSCPKGCSKKKLTFTNAAHTVSLKALLKKPLKVKTKITVTVAKPGAVSAVKVLEIRARKEPRVTTLCLAPGAKKPTACV